MATTQIPDDVLVLLNHKRSRRRAAAFRAAHPRENPAPRRNPYMGSHPDLFATPPGQTARIPERMALYPRRPGPLRRGKDGSEIEEEMHRPLFGTAGARAYFDAQPGESPTFVPLSDLTSEQIRELKRSQFNDSEWGELDEDDREWIEEHDAESQVRVDNLANVFIKRWEWETNPDDNHAFERVEEHFEYILQNEVDDLWKWIRNAAMTTYNRLVLYAEDHGQSDTDVDGYLNAYLADTNSYTFTTARVRGGRVVWSMEYEANVYLDDDDWHVQLAQCTPDEVARAVKKIDHDTNSDIDIDVGDLYKKSYFDFTFDSGSTVHATVDLDSVMESITNEINEHTPELEDADDPPDAKPPEERVVYRWPDGFYVLDLLPSELAEEGKTMGMCVGRADMGYGRAVRDGEIKILSVRRPSGKPLFTIEAELDNRRRDEVVIKKLDQVKGKANRLPGYDLGKTAPGTPLKKDEVVRMYELIEGPGGFGEIGLEQAVDDVQDMKPAAREVNRLYREGDKWATDLLTRLGIESSQVASWREGAGDEPRQNPGPACGRHGENCSGFCAPYRRR